MPWEDHPATPTAVPTAKVPGAPGTPGDSPGPAQPTVPATPRADDSDDSNDGSDGGADDLEADVVDLTNDIRADEGCEADLTIEDRLITAARGHSADMADRDYFDHTSPEGVGPGGRAADAGYDAWGGENIAVGYPTAQAVVDAWMDSDGHRANILNCGFVAIGVGAVPADDDTMYWTQTFGWE